MTKKTAPPRHLTASARALWSRIHADYQLDDGAGLALLATACEAFDRLAQARAILKKEGVIVHDRWGQPRAHPAVAIERDSRNGLLAALRGLKLSPSDYGV